MSLERAAVDFQIPVMGERALDGAAMFLCILAYPENEVRRREAFEACICHRVRSYRDSRKDLDIDEAFAARTRPLIDRWPTRDMWGALEMLNKQLLNRQRAAELLGYYGVSSIVKPDRYTRVGRYQVPARSAHQKPVILAAASYGERLQLQLIEDKRARPATNSDLIRIGAARWNTVQRNVARNILTPAASVAHLALSLRETILRQVSQPSSRRLNDTIDLLTCAAWVLPTIYAQTNPQELTTVWRNPAGEFGAQFIAMRLVSINQVKGAIAFLARHREAKNRVLLSDLMASLFALDVGTIDLKGLEFQGGKFTNIALGEAHVENVTFVDSTFEYLDITDAEISGVAIKDSCIVRLAGVTSKDHLPAWISNSLVETFQSIKTLTAIREAGLSTAQTFLLSSLRKLFLQPGAGRKESSMYKGYGDHVTKRICEKVIAILLREGFCSKTRGNTETLYLPNRAFTGRVKSIMSQLTTSKDDLWIRISDIS